jgi:uncharacterized protein (DUF4415 family)
MGKMIINNAEEVRRESTTEKLARLARKKIPVFSTGITDEDMAAGKVKRIGRGFAAFKENINRSGRPTVAEKKVVVSIRLPSSDAEKLRTMGKGWQTKVGNYLVHGIRQGKLAGTKTQGIK